MSKQRAKGTNWENDLVGLFRQRGFPKAHRMPFSSPLGDLGGTTFVCEAKNQKSITLSEFIDQAARSGARTGRPYVVFQKRIRKPPAECYAITTGAIMLDLLRCWDDNHPDDNPITAAWGTYGQE